MIDWTAITTVLSVYIVGVVLPGPNFVAVAPTFLGMLATVAIVASVWYGIVAVVFALGIRQLVR